MGQQTRQRTGSRSMVQRFVDLAVSRRLLTPGDRLLVAVSGGADSVALLSLLAELAVPYDLGLRALHINYGLRGEESEGDAQFVATLCQQLDVDLWIERVTIPAKGDLRGGQSVQEWAREARYAAMRRIAEVLGANRIALGHTADDQAETVLLWMLRGCGARGLAGIPALREGRYTRPLLGFRRADILAYLDNRGLPFRVDSSNANPVYLRNRIRHELLPVLQGLNPAIVEVLCRQAEILSEEDRWMEERTAAQVVRLARDGDDGVVTLDRMGFVGLPLALQRRILRSLLCRIHGTQRSPTFGVVSAILEDVVHGPSGTALSVQGGQVTREYDTIRIQPISGNVAGPAVVTEVPLPGITVAVPSTVRWPLTGEYIRVWTRDVREADRSCAQGLPPTRALMDVDRVHGELRVRSWQPGDTFQPAGMGGRRKKLQDFFSDSKVPRRKRHRVPLLVTPEEVVWVAGYRSDHRYRISASTTRVLVAELVTGPA